MCYSIHVSNFCMSVSFDDLHVNTALLLIRLFSPLARYRVQVSHKSFTPKYFEYAVQSSIVTPMNSILIICAIKKLGKDCVKK